MQMSYFRKILIKPSLKYIPCSLKRCIIHVCILTGFKVMQFWHLFTQQQSNIMNVTETFRRLVTNKFLTNLNYSEYVFSFQTVFYQTYYSYRCCECAFEHEYLDYISLTGITESVYSKILQSVKNDRCPHVAGVDEKFIRETSITVAHVACKVGTKRAVKRYIQSKKCRMVRGNMYMQTP